LNLHVVGEGDRASDRVVTRLVDDCTAGVDSGARYLNRLGESDAAGDCDGCTAAYHRCAGGNIVSESVVLFHFHDSGGHRREAAVRVVTRTLQGERAQRAGLFADRTRTRNHSAQDLACRRSILQSRTRAESDCTRIRAHPIGQSAKRTFSAYFDDATVRRHRDVTRERVGARQAQEARAGLGDATRARRDGAHRRGLRRSAKRVERERRVGASNTFSNRQVGASLQLNLSRRQCGHLRGECRRAACHSNGTNSGTAHRHTRAANRERFADSQRARNRQRRVCRSSTHRGALPCGARTECCSIRDGHHTLVDGSRTRVVACATRERERAGAFLGKAARARHRAAERGVGV